MAIGHRALMQECFPKHSRMPTARTKETDEDGTKRGVSVERSKAGTNKRSPDGLSHLTKIRYCNNKQKRVIFYKKWKKYNEIQLTKSRMDSNIRKLTNDPPSPGNVIY